MCTVYVQGIYQDGRYGKLNSLCTERGHEEGRYVYSLCTRKISRWKVGILNKNFYHLQ